ncbi:MAG: hypothetical protein QW453_02735 [Thermoprotei archaeon]
MHAPRWLMLVIGSIEFKAFVFVWALQYIAFWFVANAPPIHPIESLGGSVLSNQTVTPPPTSIPSGGQNGLGGIITIATHPTLLHYTLEIFKTNFIIMVLVSIPFFGLAYGEYIMIKIGAAVNYASSYISVGSHTLSPLVLSGLLLTSPFYYLEVFAYALACSAGLLGGVTLFRPSRRRVLWYIVAICVSTLMLVVGAFLEASFVLRYH